MILQALNGYYERLASEPDSQIPPYGFSLENISYALVLSSDGQLLDVEDLRIQEGKALRPRKLLVPAAEKKTSGVKANFLWDSTSYVLAADDKGKPERAAQCQAAFLDKILAFGDASDPGLKAVTSFLQNGDQAVTEREDWPEISGTNLVFRLDGVPGYVHDRSAARVAWERCLDCKEESSYGQCLVSGEEHQPLARLHPSIKGVRGAQSSGASIVSFNLNAFVSYGKDQSYNAPVGVRPAFKYTTALNGLLARDSRQKVTIGDTTMVFWAECASPAEDFLAELFDPPIESEKADGPKDDQQTASKIRGLLQAIRDGRKPTDFLPGLDESVQFFILGLSPNASRLSVRFWEANSLGTLLRRVGQHFEQLSIVPQFDSEPEFPPLWRLLGQTAALGKTENILPLLAGGMAKAMLTGCPYPQNLLPVVLDRIRAEHNVTFFRAAMIKAYLMRNKQKEVSVSLNPERTDVSYLLGRLFATLEKVQAEAVPGSNATIKDRFLASASATPGLVFHMLLKNSANHVGKLRKDAAKRGRAVYFEKLSQDILNKLDDFPKTLSAEDQGMFMIGYYHQRKDFFTTTHQEG